MATCNQAVISILQLKTARLSDTRHQAQGYKSEEEGIRFDLAKVCGMTPDSGRKPQTRQGLQTHCGPTAISNCVAIALASVPLSFCQWGWLCSSQ